MHKTVLTRTNNFENIDKINKLKKSNKIFVKAMLLPGNVMKHEYTLNAKLARKSIF